MRTPEVDAPETCCVESAPAELKSAIEGGADFAQIAKENSSCPSGRNGGELGSFGPGQMVKEFDTVVFSADTV